MISRDELRKAHPTVSTATTRYIQGQISRTEYERELEHERREDLRPPKEQTPRNRPSPSAR